jgi:glucose-1-phosphate thymidylyltransferase
LSVKKGIILAGGSGSRLRPTTISISKQLHPVFDKPMIYYPLCTLMELGIQNILIICKSSDLKLFQNLFQDGGNLGVNISYQIQDVPNGLAEAFLIGEEFIDSDPVVLILGDNIFYDSNLSEETLQNFNTGALTFSYEVNNPKDYGIIVFDKNNNVSLIVEKPKNPPSNHAITGLYVYDGSIVNKAKSLKPSNRGELEISDINNLYLTNQQLINIPLEKYSHWFDTGTHHSLLEASNFVSSIQSRSNKIIFSPEEIAFRKKWISAEILKRNINNHKNTKYGSFLEKLIENHK